MRSVPAFPFPIGPLEDSEQAHLQIPSVVYDVAQFRVLQSAARAVAAGSLCGGRAPSPRELAILRMTGLPTLRKLGRGQLQLVAAGMVTARVRANDTAAAADLIEALEHLAGGECDATLPAAVLLPLECAVAEQNIAAGHPVVAATRTHQALSLAEETGDPRWVRRALGLHAAALTLSGRVMAAETVLDELSELEAHLGWESELPDLMATAAGLLIAFMQMDAEKIRGLLSKMQVPTPRHHRPAAFMTLMAALEQHSDGESHRALQLATMITSGPEGAVAASFVRIAALLLQGAILIDRGEPLRAVTLLEGLPSPRGHALCFPASRASAFLALGQHQKVLEVTSECMKLRASHNARTLPAVLLRRAIAHMRLGQDRSALNDATDALLMSAATYPSSSLALIPAAELAALRTFVIDRRPDLEGEVLWLEQGMATVREPQPPPSLLPHMTRRERLVALHLRSTRPYPEIAREMRVAPSTVKSQALSVFRKLHVHSREEAVFLLEQLGFFDQ